MFPITDREDFSRGNYEVALEKGTPPQKKKRKLGSVPVKPNTGEFVAFRVTFDLQQVTPSRLPGTAFL